MGRRSAPLLVAVLLIAGGVLLLRLTRTTASVHDAGRHAGVRCSQVDRAYRDHQSGTWLTLSAQVTRLLPDEQSTLVHQRFIVACPSGQTVLIVNDVSIGQRVPVHLGDEVIVRGEYVWNRLGGLLHFTHHSLNGGQGGWIYFRSRLYSVGTAPVDQPV